MEVLGARVGRAETNIRAFYDFPEAADEIRDIVGETLGPLAGCQGGGKDHTPRTAGSF